MYFLAPGIADKKRKKALLLYFEGEEHKKIDKALHDEGDTFKLSKVALNNYFKHKLNLTFKRHRFRTTTQN